MANEETARCAYVEKMQISLIIWCLPMSTSVSGKIFEIFALKWCAFFFLHCSKYGG